MGIADHLHSVWMSLATDHGQNAGCNWRRDTNDDRVLRSKYPSNLSSNCRSMPRKTSGPFIRRQWHEGNPPSRQRFSRIRHRQHLLHASNNKDFVKYRAVPLPESSGERAGTPHGAVWRGVKSLLYANEQPSRAAQHALSTGGRYGDSQGVEWRPCKSSAPPQRSHRAVRRTIDRLGKCRRLRRAATLK